MLNNKRKCVIHEIIMIKTITLIIFQKKAVSGKVFH